MDYKPSDFFVGVVDFFSVFLPGTLLSFLVVTFFSSYFINAFPVFQNTTVAWAAFAFSSYFLGHFIYLIGTQLDPIYDATYRRWYDEKELASLRKRAQLTSKNILHEQHDEKDSVLHWATAFVRLNSPSASTEIDRLEADSKFFRSAAIVLAIGSIAFLFTAECLLGVACIILCSLSLWRFMERRLKRTQLTYEFFIALNAPEITNKVINTKQRDGKK